MAPGWESAAEPGLNDGFSPGSPAHRDLRPSSVTGKETIMRHGSAIALVLALLGASTAALALTEPRIVDAVLRGRSATRVAQGAPGPSTGAGELSARQVIERLEGQGYAAITEVEREDGRYEVLATRLDGRRVELRLDARTGEIVRSEDRR
jgi:hypothetical protein